ncbi:MAG: DUF2202 domain-containing protein [Aquificae bacterium]|nr:DUF2202 domain-containing protein [Aquificota bacterium]
MSLPYEELNPQEVESILFVREEEKLARDVYGELNNLYAADTSVFGNIEPSEQTHMDMVEILIEKYSLEDPVAATGDQRGVFLNQEIQELYSTLVNCGLQGLKQALYVGAYIEELDIIDLSLRKSQSDNQDIGYVLSFLRAGSYKHLRAFSSAIENLGENYSPQILCEEDFQRIVSAIINGEPLLGLEPQCDYAGLDLSFSCPQ